MCISKSTIIICRTIINHFVLFKITNGFQPTISVTDKDKVQAAIILLTWRDQLPQRERVSMRVAGYRRAILMECWCGYPTHMLGYYHRFASLTYLVNLFMWHGNVKIFITWNNVFWILRFKSHFKYLKTLCTLQIKHFLNVPFKTELIPLDLYCLYVR